MAGLTSVTTILSRRVKWLGHVYGMDNTRIQKQCLFGELSSGQRSQGRPKLRYKDVCKDTMKNLKIDPKSWDRMASDRAAWRTAELTGAALREDMLTFFPIIGVIWHSPSILEMGILNIFSLLLCLLDFPGRFLFSLSY